MSFEQILVEQHGAVLVITLNRPERLNAWTPKMSRELISVIAGADEDPSVGAIVVTGAGRGFCAGADIGGEFASKLDDRPATVKPTSEIDPVSDWVQVCRRAKPLIAAINGAAIGVGLTMILPFDRLIAARTAKISARFVKMGLVTELASSHFLAARCGWGAASWLALSGVTITGEEAVQMRLVDRCVDEAELMEVALAEAALLAANPGPQMKMIKELLTRNAFGVDLGAVQGAELAALEIAYRTPEHREAVSAFIEKRAPDFRSPDFRSPN
jgi:2-(1,2-epoxy-1,2-dihydrophenyl)acetyl-CoA isomerase